MTLGELYERDIERRIDPVATVSELDADYVQKEIDEYFFTDTLFKHLHTFLDKLTGGTEGRTGVWINGYYGSGKSHFLKYIYYCLSEDFGAAALDHFEKALRTYEGDPLDQPVTERDAREVRRGLQDVAVDPVMFNIKNVSDDDRGQRSVTRTFYNRLNAHRGYNKSNIQIARFEKLLDDQGALSEFKSAFQCRTGDDWDEVANDAVGMMLSEVVEAADEVANIDTESTRQFLMQPPSATTEEFVDELERYLDTKPDDYRLVYLVDEVSQYMQGEPNLLVDLQTIVEEIGDRIGDQMWIVCTAQQELEELVETAKEKQQADYSYGKIISRFETYLPLESQQADLITKKRVLSKKPEGNDELRRFFDEHEEAIRNQFRLSSNDLYRGYDDEDEFVASYPLIPYQFKLIVEVIRAFAKADFLVPGTAGTERSLIGLTHEVAIQSKDEAIGYFVPFDEFYNARLSDKLTHRARSMIDNAMKLNRVKSNDFAQRVVKALFLLSNIARDQSINFPATAQNLAFILIDEVDPTWADLKRRTQEVLDHLVEQNVVSESEGKYRFLQEEEIRVKREIDNQQISLYDRWQAFADQVVNETVEWSSRYDLSGKTVNLHLKVDDYEDSTSGTATVQFLLYNEEEPDNLAFGADKDELLFCIHEAFGDEQRALLDEAVRINAYLQDYLDSATGERLEAMHTFKDQRDRALKDLRRWFERVLPSTTYVSAQQKLSAEDHNGQSAQAVYEAIVEKHLRRVYDKRAMVINYASDRKTLRKKAAQQQTELDDSLTEAETEMNSFLSLSTRPTMADVRRKYEKPPFGWKDTEMIHVLLSLEAKNKWTFQWKSEDVDRETFIEKAIRRQEQASVTIHEQEDVDPELMHDAAQAVNHTMFNDQLVLSTTDPKQLEENIQAALKQKENEAARHASDHTGRPFARHFKKLREALKTVRRAGDATTLFQNVIDNAEDVQEKVDLAHDLTRFWDRHSDTYQNMRELVDQHEPHAELLDPQTRSRMEKLARYVRQEDRPHDNLRTMMDYYDAVQTAVDERITELRDEAEEEYDEVFDELESRRDDLGVDDVIPDRQSRLRQIRRLDNLAALQSQISQVNEVRARYLKRLNDAAQEDADEEDRKPTDIFSVQDEISRHELETEDDVEAFVDDLRSKLLARVRAGKLVILK
jgi:hypothetical protein